MIGQNGNSRRSALFDNHLQQQHERLRNHNSVEGKLQQISHGHRDKHLNVPFSLSVFYCIGIYSPIRIFSFPSCLQVRLVNMVSDRSPNDSTVVPAAPAKVTHPPIPLWKLITSQSAFTPDVLEHIFPGSGTQEDPYLVEWIPNDSRNPLTMPQWIKWQITVIQAFAFLSITFASSAMSAADPQLEEHFGASSTLVIADTSLFILAFAIGPAVWAPLSELYGRQIVCVVTYALTTVFSGAVIASKNIGTVLVLRFFSGAFGASAVTNSGGVVSDMFTARDRAVAMLAFIGAPFLGPSIAPIACNYLAVGAGWQWVAALVTFFVGTAFTGILFVPETYHPVLLRRRATKLSELTGKIYKSKLDDQTKTSSVVFKTAMLRPWALLTREPIVLLLSLYMAISM